MNNPYWHMIENDDNRDDTTMDDNSWEIDNED